MPDYYVALVKEYLELQGFIVRTEVKYKIREKDSNGTMRTNWGDIDVLAVKIQDGKVSELIVGEVKADDQTERRIKEINQDKFENKHAKQKLHELFGSTQYKKYLFCWSWESTRQPKRKEFARNLGINPVSFDNIVNVILDKVVKREGWLYLRDYPNLMLLQFLQERGYLSGK